MPADLSNRHPSYQSLVKAKAPKAPVLAHLATAFLAGGLLCLLGQGILNLFIRLGFTPEKASPPTLAAMIFLGAAATALGVYDRLGEFGGAGAAIPITGFANSIVSAAMDYRREGIILGLGAKMFLIAGPVLVFGILAGFLIGLIKVFLWPLLIGR